MTPLSSSSPYCTPARFFDYFDYRAVGDLVRDDLGTSPTRMAMLDETDVAGAVVLRELIAASGLVEAAATKGQKYSIDDLGAITGASKAHLERITAGLAFGILMERRQPVAADRQRVPAIAAADELLEKLRLGEHVFGFTETRAAGEGMDSIVATDSDTPAARRAQDSSIVNRASRLLGNRRPHGGY